MSENLITSVNKFNDWIESGIKDLQMKIEKVGIDSERGAKFNNSLSKIITWKIDLSNEDIKKYIENVGEDNFIDNIINYSSDIIHEEKFNDYFEKIYSFELRKKVKNEGGFENKVYHDLVKRKLIIFLEKIVEHTYDREFNEIDFNNWTMLTDWGIDEDIWKSGLTVSSLKQAGGNEGKIFVSMINSEWRSKGYRYRFNFEVEYKVGKEMAKFKIIKSRMFKASSGKIESTII